jgi:hypothetical protein
VSLFSGLLGLHFGEKPPPPFSLSTTSLLQEQNLHCRLLMLKTRAQTQASAMCLHYMELLLHRLCTCTVLIMPDLAALSEGRRGPLLSTGGTACCSSRQWLVENQQAHVQRRTASISSGWSSTCLWLFWTRIASSDQENCVPDHASKYHDWSCSASGAVVMQAMRRHLHWDVCCCWSHGMVSAMQRHARGLPCTVVLASKQSRRTVLQMPTSSA